MLHIKLEETSLKKAKVVSYEEEKEEMQSESGASFLIDTSDMSSQSDGSIYSKNSPNEGGEQGGDHYQKIKNHAVLCLQYLFKSNSKTLFNYWYILYPSHFIKPASEFS
jgi:hypothetical protein